MDTPSIVYLFLQCVQFVVLYYSISFSPDPEIVSKLFVEKIKEYALYSYNLLQSNKKI